MGTFGDVPVMAAFAWPPNAALGFPTKEAFYWFALIVSSSFLISAISALS